MLRALRGYIPSVVGEGLSLEKLADLAQVGTFFIALVALSIAYVQIVAARESQREATAKDVFRDSLRLAFEHPDYAIPKQGLKSDDKYGWFVAVILNACDEIAVTVLPDQGWQHVVRGTLEYHKEYLASAEFLEDGGWQDYSKELKIEFDAMITDAKRDNLPM